MRSLGYIDGRKPTEQFVAFLLTQKIKSHIESCDGSDRWEIWIRNEDQLEIARQELDTFLNNRSDPRYELAIKEATKLLDADLKARQAAAKNVRRIQPGTRAAVLGRGSIPPLTLTLTILCVLVSLLSGFSQPSANNKWGQTIVKQLKFVDAEAYERSNRDPAASLKRGEIWRAVTPIFMHGNPLHLAMNMMLLVSLGRLIERLLGTPRFAVLVLLAAILPNLLQGLSPSWMRGSPHFVGISGVVYALFGYIWIRSVLNPELGIIVPMPIVVLMVGVILVGLTMNVPGWNLADLCHLGGLLVGVGLAFASHGK